LDKIDPYDFGFYYALSKDKQLIDREDTSVIFYDLDVLKKRMTTIRELFPHSSLHTVAIKSNPLLGVLNEICTYGFGLEAASFEELLIAKHTGLEQQKMVFDSPVKTNAEIRCINDDLSSIYINANHIGEIERYQEYDLKLGLRINPMNGINSIKSMNVSSETSKFGEPIINEEQILSACLKTSTISGLHVHVGSQIDHLNLAIEGISKVVRLANRINDASKGKIKWIDIGGGFPVNYKGDSYDIDSYVQKIKVACPELFNGTYKLITEFGRYYHANAGWVVSTIESIKEDTGHILTHVGADMFLREVYNPDDWFHQLNILDKDGKLKVDDLQKYSIGGPLCFGGDYIAKDRSLPKVEMGDSLVVSDVGANSFALWSRHCSRSFPKVISYSSSQKGKDMKVIKKREKIEDIIKFWS